MGKTIDGVRLDAGFCITDHNGFRMTFENGWGISVQWGPGDYTDEDIYAVLDHRAPAKSTYWPATKAEIAILNPSGGFHSVKAWGDQIKGYCQPDEVLKWMNYAARQKPHAP